MRRSYRNHILLCAIATAAILAWCIPVGATVSSIASNFNGTAINRGNFIWFNLALNPGSLATDTSFVVNNQSVTFAGAVPNPILLPNAIVNYSSSASTCTTTFNSGTNTWTTTLPLAGAKNSFAGGFGYLVPSPGLPGGINPVTWSADFHSTPSPLTVQWQWAAAVYTSFSSDPNALGVKGCANGDTVGTPENFKSFVTGGARGGGGSNFTGSYSGTASVVTNAAPPIPDASTVALACFGAVPLFALRRRLFTLGG